VGDVYNLGKFDNQQTCVTEVVAIVNHSNMALTFATVGRLDAALNYASHVVRAPGEPAHDIPSTLSMYPHGRAIVASAKRWSEEVRLALDASVQGRLAAELVGMAMEDVCSGGDTWPAMEQLETSVMLMKRSYAIPLADEQTKQYLAKQAIRAGQCFGQFARHSRALFFASTFEVLSGTQPVELWGQVEQTKIALGWFRVLDSWCQMSGAFFDDCNLIESARKFKDIIGILVSLPTITGNMDLTSASVLQKHFSRGLEVDVSFAAFAGKTIVDLIEQFKRSPAYMETDLAKKLQSELQPLASEKFAGLKDGGLSVIAWVLGADLVAEDVDMAHLGTVKGFQHPEMDLLYLTHQLTKQAIARDPKFLFFVCVCVCFDLSKC
jgi:hypothetical protein